MENLTWKDLKKLVDKMNEKQLSQPVVVFKGDAEQGEQIDYYEKSKQSFYWLDGDCYGDRKSTLEQIRDNNKEFPYLPLFIGDFLCVPKGTVTLHIEDNQSS